MEEKILIRGNFSKINMLVIASGTIAILLGIIGLFLFVNGFVPNTINTVFEGIILWCIAGAFLVIAILTYLIMNNCEIIVSNKKVSGKIKFGKRVDLPINQISSVGQGWFKSITVATSSGIIRFWLLENRQEVFSVISNLLSQIQNSSQCVSENISNFSNAEELKKYKELLDTGVITQEEFEAKKKQLLGLEQSPINFENFAKESNTCENENATTEIKHKSKTHNKKLIIIISIIVLISIIIVGFLISNNTNTSSNILDNFTITDHDHNVILEQDDFKSINEINSNNQHYIEIKLTKEGQQKFAKATKSISNEKGENNYVIIYQNNEVISAPKVSSEIDTDTLNIPLN